MKFIKENWYLIAGALAMLVWLGFSFYAIDQWGKEIDAQGGIGKSIGHFIKDIRESAE